MTEGKKQPGGAPHYLVPLLAALRSDPTLCAYYRDLLTPLVRYDSEHGGDLVKTLAHYVQQGGNATRAANSLFLHRNSLRYRLARIYALLGMDPDAPDARLALGIALLVRAEIIGFDSQVDIFGVSE